MIPISIVSNIFTLLFLHIFFFICIFSFFHDIPLLTIHDPPDDFAHDFLEGFTVTFTSKALVDFMRLGKTRTGSRYTAFLRVGGKEFGFSVNLF